MASLFGLQKMHPVVVKSCGHRMWSLVVSIVIFYSPNREAIKYKMNF